MTDRRKLTNEHAKLIAQVIQRYAEWEARIVKRGLPQTTGEKITWRRQSRAEITSPAHTRTTAGI